jgi:hypothetical protein
MTAQRLTGTSAIILALVILAWHIFPQVMSAGYPHYSALFYVLLVVAWVVLVLGIVGLCRIMRARD